MEIPAFCHLQSKHLRKIPAAIQQTQRNISVSKITALGRIGIRPSYQLHRIGDVLHFWNLPELVSQPLGFITAIISADIQHCEIILVIAAGILLHELALPLDKQHEDEQRRGNHELEAHKETPQRLSGR